MIHSMTAFARCEEQLPLGLLIWELRSVNHRYLDISLRLPEEFRSLEPAVRERVGKRLARGKLDITLKWLAAPSANASVQINQTLLAQYLQACTSLLNWFPDLNPVNPLELLKIPGMLMTEELPLDVVLAAARSSLETALDALIASRRAEGARLADTLRERAETIATLVRTVALQRPEVLQKQRDKLRSRLQELQQEVQVDAARLEQEMVIAAQRLDIDEELDRLRSHLTELNAILDAPEPVGRKLDFLMQEFNREANTLSSKSSDTTTTRSAVEMKVLIEQMREQVQNIE